MQAGRIARFILATVFASAVGGIAGGTLVERLNNAGQGQGILRPLHEIEDAFGGILGAGLAGSAIGIAFGRQRNPA